MNENKEKDIKIINIWDKDRDKENQMHGLTKDLINSNTKEWKI